METISDRQVVAELIEELINECVGGRVSKFYVVETLKNRMSPIHLFNKTLSAGRATDDGIKNIHRGAQKVYTDSMRSLSKRYQVDDDGWITRRTGENYNPIGMRFDGDDIYVNLDPSTAERFGVELFELFNRFGVRTLRRLQAPAT